MRRQSHLKISIFILLSSHTPISHVAEIKEQVQDTQNTQKSINFTNKEFEYLHQCTDPVYLSLQLIDSLKLLDPKAFETNQQISSLLKACNENFKFHSKEIINEAIQQLNINQNLENLNSVLNDYQIALNNDDAKVTIKENNNIECNLLAADCCTSQINFENQETVLDIQPLEVDGLTRATAKVFRQPIVIRFNSNSQNALTVFGSVGFNGVANFRERATFQKNARVQQNLNVDLNANISGTMNATNANVSGTTTTTNLVAGSGSITSLTSTTANVTSGLTVGGQLLNNGQQVLTNLSNLGSGQGIFANKTSDTANLKSLVAGSNIQLTPSSNEITITALGSGTGNVTGPVSSTTNAAARFADTSGMLLKNSNVIISDAGDVTTPATVTANAITDGTMSISGGNITGVDTLSATNIAATTSLTLAGSSVVTDALNEGTGAGIFDTKTGSTLNFKSLVAGSNITLDTTTPGEIAINAASGGGDVTGPASSTDNAVARFDGTTGKIIQNSAVTIDDSGTISTAGNFNLSTSNNTNLTAGVITKGGLAFLHNLSTTVGNTSNTYVGLTAGDSTTTATNNTAVGSSALTAILTGPNNTAIGTGALQSITSHQSNTAIGSNAMSALPIGGGMINNTAVGSSALQANRSGSGNIAIGFEALLSNTSGSNNVAGGTSALKANLNAGNNVAIGFESMLVNTTGGSNVAIGTNTLRSNTTATDNTAIGNNALTNSTGAQNAAFGAEAGQNITSGTTNTLVGYQAGNAITTGSNNIEIGNTGDVSDSGVIRIGTAQTKTFIAGIRGITTTNNDAVAVLIDSAGQLGTISSSRRYKNDIQEMQEESSNLTKLRPVTFKYKNDENKTLQYGLIAEEVAQVMPELVAFDKEGRPETVKYHLLGVLLVNEFKKLQEKQQNTNALINKLEQEIQTLEQKG